MSGIVTWEHVEWHHSNMISVAPRETGVERSLFPPHGGKRLGKDRYKIGERRIALPPVRAEGNAGGKVREVQDVEN